MVGFMGVGVDSVRDELLAVAQEFEFLALLAFERHRNLRERRVASERNRALGPESGAAKDCALFPEMIADQLFDRLRGVRVIDVDVECRGARSENAGVFGVGIGALPPSDLVLGDTDHLLPFAERRPFAVGRNRVEAGAAELEAGLGDLGWRRHLCGFPCRNPTRWKSRRASTWGRTLRGRTECRRRGD